MAFDITYVNHNTGTEIDRERPKANRNIPTEGQRIYLESNGQDLYRVNQVRHNYENDWPHVEVRVTKV
jgi:hypothetical protein